LGFLHRYNFFSGQKILENSIATCKKKLIESACHETQNWQGFFVIDPLKVPSLLHFKEI
jgi:hypothetical protein